MAITYKRPSDQMNLSSWKGVSESINSSTAKSNICRHWRRHKSMLNEKRPERVHKYRTVGSEVWSPKRDTVQDVAKAGSVGSLLGRKEIIYKIPIVSRIFCLKWKWLDWSWLTKRLDEPWDHREDGQRNRLFGPSILDLERKLGKLNEPPNPTISW